MPAFTPNAVSNLAFVVKSNVITSVSAQGFSIFKITRIPYQLLSNMVKRSLVELECHPWPSKFPWAFVDVVQRQTAGDDIAEKSISRQNWGKPDRCGQSRWNFDPVGLHFFLHCLSGDEIVSVNRMRDRREEEGTFGLSPRPDGGRQTTAGSLSSPQGGKQCWSA